jgi:hypothetical protein
VPRKNGIEAQANKLARLGIPSYYPVGAQKAWDRMQKQYGSAEGRRIFIQKALDRGQGQTLREKVSSVYKKGAKLK